MLVGHNPGMEDFIRFLTGQLEPMPTAAVAVVSLDVDSWADITGSCGRVDRVLRPKELMNSRQNLTSM
jgi:phosphohistidine phosphatase